MRKLVLQMQVSVDGFVGRPDGNLEWIFPDFSEDFVAWEVERLGRAGAHLMGSSTYRDMAAYWPTSSEPYAAPMNGIPKIVFSRSLTTADWKETQVAAGDLEAEIKTLKGQAGAELLAHGGSRFARSLTRAGLVDEYRLLVHPIALGRGLRLFDPAEPMRLKLVETTTFKSGLVAVVYHPA